MKRCIELGIADVDQEAGDEEEEQIPEGFSQKLDSESGWVDLEGIAAAPPVSLDNIHHYFVTKRLKRDDVTASKPFEKGYRIYHAQKVRNVAVHRADTDCYDIVRATVMPSQRQDREYRTSVAVHRSLGEVTYGYCTCVAGKCSTCNHVAALLFHLDNYNRSRPSCTSLPCQWKKPPQGKNSPQKVTKLKIEKPKIGHTTKELVRFEPMDRIRGYVSMNRVMQLRKDLSACHTGTLGFHQVWPETVDVRQEAQLVDQLTKWHAAHSEN